MCVRPVCVSVCPDRAVLTNRLAFGARLLEVASRINDECSPELKSSIIKHMGSTVKEHVRLPVCVNLCVCMSLMCVYVRVPVVCLWTGICVAVCVCVRMCVCIVCVDRCVCVCVHVVHRCACVLYMCVCMCVCVWKGVGVHSLRGPHS